MSHLQRPGAPGALMLIGGGEDRTDDKEVLQAFIDVSGGKDARLVLLTAASETPDKVWEEYRRAFNELGASALTHVRLADRNAVHSAELARRLAEAQGIFITGGDQQRLLDLLGNSPLHQAMRRAYTEGGACLAGTSAGASGLCSHMLSEGGADAAPEKHAVRLAPGLGFVRSVIVDQHFLQRHRISRLLSIVAEQPQLLGAGIDEDTALLVRGDHSLEVLGRGSVTLLDCRAAQSNVAELAPGETPHMLDVRLHLLPRGVRCGAGRDTPALLADFIRYVLDGSGEREER